MSEVSFWGDEESLSQSLFDDDEENSHQSPFKKALTGAMYCRGWHDMNGEWIPNLGDFYEQISRHFNKSNHNYQINIYHNRKKEWHLTIYLCLTASNSNEIEIFDKCYSSKKYCKEKAVKFLENFDSSESAKDLIKEWKLKKAKPVFIIDKKGDPSLIGTVYGHFQIEYDSVRGYLKKDDYIYYNEDIPNYKDTNIGDNFYILDTRKGESSLIHYKMNMYGYSMCRIKEDDLLIRIFERIKDIEKYQHMLPCK